MLLWMLCACVSDGKDGSADDTGAGPDTQSNDTDPGDTDPGDTDSGDTGDTGAASGRWVMGYYVGYQRDRLPAADVDFTAITHLAVGPIVPRPNGTLDTTMYTDAVTGPELARDLSARTHAAGRTAILMLGGAGTRDAFAAAASDANRATFVAELLATLDDLGYDGLDLDWEPIYEEDEAPLAALVADLRAARPGIVLTIPVAWMSMNFPEVSGFYADIAPHVDQINLMTYGMADAWPGWLSWHSSALDGAEGQTPSSVAVSAQAYLDAGVPAAKLGVGIGFYGSCWNGGVTAPRQEPGAGIVVASDNTMSYAAIAEDYLPAGTYAYDDAAEAPYVANAGGMGELGCTFVSYEDERSIAAKGAWVAANGLGGAIIWTINQGHLADAPAGEQDPLLTAARSAFLE